MNLIKSFKQRAVTSRGRVFTSSGYFNTKTLKGSVDLFEAGQLIETIEIQVMSKSRTKFELIAIFRTILQQKLIKS